MAGVRPDHTFAVIPDPGQARSLDELVEGLRSLKVWAGDPSYEAITGRVNKAWTVAGRPARELTKKATVVDCLRCSGDPHGLDHAGSRQNLSRIDAPDVSPYVVPVWQYALWGAVGAAANIGVVFLEASRRVKGWPWERPKGPGGAVYAASVVIQLGVASATTAALAAAAIVTNAFVAFGIGATAPSVVNKVAKYAETLIPSNNEQVRRDEKDKEQPRGDGEDDDGS